MSYQLAARQNLGRIADSMRAITDKAEKQNNRGLTHDEVTKWQGMRDEYERIEASIQIAEKNDSIAGQLSRSEFNNINETNLEQVRDEFRTDRHRERQKTPADKAFSAYLRNGVEGLNTEERGLLRFVPNSTGGTPIQNTMSTTTGSQGGFVIPQGFSDVLDRARKWFGGIDGTVGKFTTATGAPVPYPTVNDTTNRGRIIGQQNVQVSQTDVAFGQVTFNAYIGSSDLVLIPLALMQDSYFDLNALLASLLGERLGRLYNWKCTIGTGTNEPTGIVTAATTAGNVLTLGAGNTTSISYNNLVDLEHSVDPAYRDVDSARWMFSDAELKSLKKLVDGQNRPLWQPGLTASFQQGAAVMTGSKPKILEHEYVVNNDMASPAASGYSMLFGDMSKFKVREVEGGTTVMRLTERYADYLQIGFISWQRFDSNIVDAGTHPIAVLQQSAS